MSEKEIVDYLLHISSKTPSIVDKKRLDAVKSFVKRPALIQDPETTQLIATFFKENWLSRKLHVIKPSEELSMKKVTPGIGFGRVDQYAAVPF